MLKDEYKKINPDDIKVGDEVTVLAYPQYGWSKQYRKPIAIKCIVERITPARTKIITNKGELMVNNTTFYDVNDENLLKDDHVARHFKYACEHNKFEMADLADLSDEDIIDVAECLAKITDIMRKHKESKED